MIRATDSPLLQWASSGYDPAKKFGQSQHTLAAMFAAVDRLFAVAEARTRRKQQVAEYLGWMR